MLPYTLLVTRFPTTSARRKRGNHGRCRHLWINPPGGLGLRRHSDFRQFSEDWDKGTMDRHSGCSAATGHHHLVLHRTWLAEEELAPVAAIMIESIHD